MTSIDDERKAAREAKAVVSLLVPSTLPTKAQREHLHKAARVATEATMPRYTSQAALDDTRREADKALRGLLGDALTRDMIENARGAIEAWLKALDDFGV